MDLLLTCMAVAQFHTLPKQLKEDMPELEKVPKKGQPKRSEHLPYGERTLELKSELAHCQARPICHSDIAEGVGPKLTVPALTP